MAFRPDGKWIASSSGARFPATKPHEAKLWDASTGQELLDLKGHIGPVWNVAFTPDGKRLVSGSADGQVKVWLLDGWLEKARREESTHAANVGVE